MGPIWSNPARKKCSYVHVYSCNYRVVCCTYGCYSQNYQKNSRKVQIERLITVQQFALQPSFSSSLPWILVSGDTPELSARWRQVLAAVSVSDGPSSDQILVSEPLPCNARHEAVQPLQGMPLHVALIQPERELVNVAMQVLVAGVVIDAMQATLQDSPNALNTVGRHAIVPDVLASAMNDGFVLVVAVQSGIAAVLIGMDRRARLDALANFHAQRLGIGAVNGPRYRAPAAFAHAENRRLADRTASRVQLFVIVLVGLFAADVRLVDFDDAGELAEILTASLAKTTEDEPCGFLGDADFLGKLHGRDALARRDEQVHRVNPLVQRNVRPLEDRSGANRKILFALVAAVEAVFARRDPVASSANWAARAFRPKQPLQIGPRGFLIGKHLEKLEGRNRALAHRAAPCSTGVYSRFELGSQIYNSH